MAHERLNKTEKISFFMIETERNTLSERILRWVFSEKNRERYLKYWWIISTIRIVVGISLLLLMILGGYKFTHHPW
jgi:hypothetical protein